jgi:hypothetical protein
LAGETKVPGKKTCLSVTFPPQIPHFLTLARTWAAAVKSGRQPPGTARHLFSGVYQMKRNWPNGRCGHSCLMFVRMGSFVPLLRLLYNWPLFCSVSKQINKDYYYYYYYYY